MKSLDTETTGLDLRLDARPYLLTTCNPERENSYYEWEVDPVERMPLPPGEDLREFNEVLRDEDIWWFQNSLFDVAALASFYRGDGWEFPWEKVRDTLLAAHLLASGNPKDLTTLSTMWLGVHVAPYEARMKAVVLEARKICKDFLPTWKIAARDLPGHPSFRNTGVKLWKSDAWVPAEVARRRPDLLSYAQQETFRTTTPEYANVDSLTTLEIGVTMEAELKERDLWDIYLFRLKLLPVIFAMEEQGVTLSEKRLHRLVEDYTQETKKAGSICVNIAEGMGHELVLPKSGNNNSLLDFVEAKNGCDLIPLVDPHAGEKYGSGNSANVLQKRKGKPGFSEGGRVLLNKVAMRGILEGLEERNPRGKPLRFMKNLGAKRKRDTALIYMEGYQRFWKPWVPAWEGAVDEETGEGWYVLHPHLNPTGTNTLRFSSSNPNEQNISKKEGFNLRYCFGPAPGREWWSMDAKNIELRIPAYESGEPSLIDLFERPNDPPFYGSQHMLNFSVVYPDVWGEAVRGVGEDKAGPWCKEHHKSGYYTWVKNGDFAVQYGAVDVLNPNKLGTADKAFRRKGSQARLAERFSKQDELNQHWIAFANRHGYVETMPDKTVNPRRGYPLEVLRNYHGKIKPTIPLNYHVQGTAMWWMCKAMVRVKDLLDRVNRVDEKLTRAVRLVAQSNHGRGGYHIIMQVHDELVFDFPAGTGPEPWRTNLPIANAVRKTMERGGDDIGVPTPCDMEYHPNNWSEGTSVPAT